MKTPKSIMVTLLIVSGVAGLLQAQKNFSADDLNEIERNERDANAWKYSLNPVDIGANYDVKYYRCWWNLDPDVHSISGNVTCMFAPLEPGLGGIELSLYPNFTVDSVIYHGAQVQWELYNYHLFMTYPTTPQSIDSVTVYYHGIPPNNGAFVNSNHNGIPILWTFSLLGSAADWWPCKPGLRDKADSIDIYVNTPSEYIAASVGVLVSETVNDENTVYHWKHRYPIVNYAINVAITNYAVYTHQVPFDGQMLNIYNYVYPEDSTELSVETGILVPAIQLFDSLFGIYPFQNEKYGQAQYNAATGMENQTISFLSNFSYNIMTHELAHSWFGDKLTCGSWADVWLNEGFAVYLTTLCFEYFKPGQLHNRLAGFINNVASLPGGSVYCPDTLNMGRVFDDRLSYQKGCLILHQLRWVIGDSAFFAALRNYANDPDLIYGFVRTSDLIEHFESSYGHDLSWYFDDWFMGEGYPSYTVNVIHYPSHDATVIINQSQSHSSVDFFEMPVQVRFSGDGSDTTIVFNHTFSGETFNINTGFTITSVEFDPDLRLISDNNQVTLGTDDFPSGKELKIMPNPARDILIVQHNLGKISLVEILNIDGKNEQIKLKKEEEKRIEINLQNLKPGMYLLKIVYNEGMITRKFVKE